MRKYVYRAGQRLEAEAQREPAPQSPPPQRQPVTQSAYTYRADAPAGMPVQAAPPRQQPRQSTDIPPARRAQPAVSARPQRSTGDTPKPRSGHAIPPAQGRRPRSGAPKNGPAPGARQPLQPAMAAAAAAAPSRRAPAASVRASQAYRRSGTRPAAAKKAPAKKTGLVARAVIKFTGVFTVFLLAVVILLFGAVTIVSLGPFPTAKELFVVSVNETSAVKFLSRIYFSEEEVQAILNGNAIQASEEVTDTNVQFTPPVAEEQDTPDLEIIDISGSTFKGKMMIVKDPSRIKLATLDTFGNDLPGKQVEQFVADSGAIAGINAGGFADLNGVGKGGMPLGLMIKDGQIICGSGATACNIIGFSYENQLVVGYMSGNDALALGVRDAVHFEPTLIVNGNPAEVQGTGGGLNPRTVIGQRADGAVLLLVIDGRQAHSVGATLQDCMQVMLDHGAVNAANLDGGSSSMMVYEGEVINVCASLYGSRNQPAAWVVM